MTVHIKLECYSMKELSCLRLATQECEMIEKLKQKLKYILPVLAAAATLIILYKKGKFSVK